MIIPEETINALHEWVKAVSESADVIKHLSDSLPEGLEEAAEESWDDYEYREHPQGLYSSCYQDGFIAGAEWGMNQCPLPEDTTIFLKGVAEGKRLMMEEAVEGIAEELYNDGEIHCTVGVGTYFKPGDKVYVIKEDGE